MLLTRSKLRKCEVDTPKSKLRKYGKCGILVYLASHFQSDFRSRTTDQWSWRKGRQSGWEYEVSRCGAAERYGRGVILHHLPSWVPWCSLSKKRWSICDDRLCGFEGGWAALSLDKGRRCPPKSLGCLVYLPGFYSAFLARGYVALILFIVSSL